MVTMNQLVHGFYLFIILILVIILLVYKHMTTPPSLKGAYLNYSSTNARKNGTLNPSDLAYPQILESRQDFFALCNKLCGQINAPFNSRVIINSGATESIAQCVWWAKQNNQFGIVQGTDYDHSAVKDNCENFGLTYDNVNLRKNKILDNCSMIFLTQVDSKTGEVLDMNNFKRNILDKYNYLYSDSSNPYNKHVRQYKPLIVLDATQSFNKIPIDMERWELNAVFFSLHKLGGPIGTGLLIINDSNNTFKPLIAGKQQGELRGGTFPLEAVLNSAHIFNQFDDANERKERWEQAYDKLTKAGLIVYKPKGKHLYNTFLIDVRRCPLGIINALAEKNIYVGNISACANETEEKASQKGGSKTHNEDNEANEEAKELKPFEKAIRISFRKSKELPDSVLDEIISAVNE